MVRLTTKSFASSLATFGNPVDNKAVMSTYWRYFWFSFTGAAGTGGSA
jgi:hypothetical protein